VPADLARRAAGAEAAYAALDIAEIAAASGRPVSMVAQTQAALDTRLGLAKLRALVSALPSDGHWQALARGAAADELAAVTRALTSQAVPLGAEAAGALAAWEKAHEAAWARARRVLEELAEAKSADLAMISVALRELRNLA
jgi:glutamate dehydrogenase